MLDVKVKTGRGFIPLVTLMGIWSISALTSLPGLAISPILGELSTVFPLSTEFDIQMLTSLPSLLIIPFIILSGKLTEKVNEIRLLQIGLVVFSLCGVLYLFASQMWQLICISALLGIGAGLIIPLSTGLISRFFTGEFRVKQFGLSSSISNLTLVLVTGGVGYLAEVNWHLPFIVYLFPLISIVLSVNLGKSMSSTPIVVPNNTETVSAGTESSINDFGKEGIKSKYLIQLMLFYGLVTFLSVIVSFNLPFLLQEYKFTSGNSGILISLFFLAIMLPGLFLNKIIDILKEKTAFYGLLFMAIGLLLIVITRVEVMIGVGCILVGLGYGVIQPAIYEKTTHTALPKKTTLALAYVMAMNYLAIFSCPFIYDFFKTIFHSHSQQLPFIINICITFVAVIWAYVKRNSFLFR